MATTGTKLLADPTEVSSLLLNCEDGIVASEFVEGGGDYPHVVSYDGEDREVIVLSDLHIGAGLNADARYGGTDNFFSDDSFARFVDHLRGLLPHGNGLLVINGDFIDFIRMTELPSTDTDFEQWSSRLGEIGIRRTPEELRNSITPKERKFGFKTHDFKSAWRLWLAAAGHHEFFEALGRWLEDGHKLIVVKGNHDLEWYWLGVRNALRIHLAKLIAASSGADLLPVLRETVLPSIDFIDDAVVIDTDLYIEHGHRYDKFTNVVGDPVLGNGEELNIPFGSFFNRYLVNRLETAYPYFDNIRPRENLLPMLIRERFPLALEVLFKHIPFMIRVIPKRYYRYMLSRFLTIVAALLLPLIAGGLLLYYQSPGLVDGLLSAADAPSGDMGLWSRIGELISSGLGNIGWLILSYFMARAVAYFQLTEPSSLNEPARDILGNTDYRIVTMGHTHTPDQFQTGGRWFFNSGTWDPVIEASSQAISVNKTYCVLRFVRDGSGRFVSSRLHHWNDSAGRLDPLPIVETR